MSDFNTQLKKKASAIKMRAAERRDLRDRVVAYMEYHPLPDQFKQKRTSRKAAPSSYTFLTEPFFAFRLRARYVQSAALLGAIFLIVGVPVLAERALPGDVLYPMKVRVNEEVRASLALSPYAKVEWEASRLERRLSEARLLAQSGRLTEEVEREVAASITRHSAAAQRTILALRETNTDEAALAEIVFASFLDAQADIMTLHEGRALAGAGGEVSLATTLASAVRDARLVAEAAPEDRHVTPTLLFALIERETTYAQELFNAVHKNATSKESRDIARRLDDIGRKIEQAQALNVERLETETNRNTTATATEPVLEVTAEEVGTTTEGSDVTAEILMEVTGAGGALDSELSQPATLDDVIGVLRGALTDIRKLVSFMNDIELRESVDVNQLVPITPTDTERTSAVEAALERTKDLRSEIEARVIDDTIRTKIDTGLTDLAGMATRAEQSLQRRSFKDAEGAALAAEALAADMRKLIGNSPLRTIADVELPTTTATTSESVEATTTPEV